MFELHAAAPAEACAGTPRVIADESGDDGIESADLDRAKTTDASADLDAAQMSGLSFGEEVLGRCRQPPYAQPAGTSRAVYSPLLHGTLQNFAGT